MKRTPVHLHLTSFGPFLDVKENPSAKIGQLIEEFIKRHDAGAAGPEDTCRERFGFELVDHSELEVSITGVEKYFVSNPATIVEIAEECDHEQSHEVYVHLGVYRGLKDKIRLEQVAYNEAHFPDGDFTGLVLDHQPIDKKGDLSHTYKTSLPLKDTFNLSMMEQGVAEMFPLAERELFELTNDAGRYLCNYIFYRSSQHTADRNMLNQNKAHRSYTLFIHVSDGDGALTVEKQAHAIFDFFKALSETLSRKSMEEVAARQNEMTGVKHPCACCEHITMEAPPGSGTYDICPVCYWEDDASQFKDPDDALGANSVSLNTAKENFKAIGACDQKVLPSVRPATEAESPVHTPVSASSPTATTEVRPTPTPSTKAASATA